MTTPTSPESWATGSVPRSPSYVGGNAEHASHVRSGNTFPAFPEQQEDERRTSATRPVRLANNFWENVARVREGLRRVLAAGARPVTRAEQWAPTLRPRAANAQVERASADYGSDVELRTEWAQLAADWGIGGYVNAADELLKRNPAAAPPGAIEAGWRLLDLLEWIDLGSTDPRSFEAWRDEP